MTNARIAKYVAFACVSAAQARHERAELYGRVVFFAVILGVFSSLWRAVAEAGMPLAADPQSLVWYLSATEWICSSRLLSRRDQGEIRRGDVVRLGRPCPISSRVRHGLGSHCDAVAGHHRVWLCLRVHWLDSSAGVFAMVVPFGIVAFRAATALYLGLGCWRSGSRTFRPCSGVAKLMFVSVV